MAVDLTRFERLEIQMEFVVPLLRGLQAELGDETVLGALQRQLDARIADAESARDAKGTEADLSRVSDGMEQWARGGALDYRVLRDDDEGVDLDVDGCAYAAMMERLGATDLGSILICGEDHVGAARVGMALDRRHTHMQGDAVCDFRFTRVELGSKPSEA